MRRSTNSSPDDHPEAEPEDAIPAWRESFPAPPGEYSLFRTFFDIASAEVVKAILELESVRCYIDPHTLEARLLGRHIELWVESRLLHRARWLLGEPDLSEAELCYLATGELPGPD